MAAAPRIARDRLALYVLQFGAVAIVLAALPYKAFDLDRYFMPKELVLLVCASVAAINCIGQRRRITVRAIDMLLAAFLVFSLISAALSTNRWAAERALAISISGAALFWVASALRKAGLGRPLLVALALAVVDRRRHLARASLRHSERILQPEPRSGRNVRKSELHCASRGDRHARHHARRAHGAARLGQRVRRRGDGGDRRDACAFAQPRRVAGRHRAGGSGRVARPNDLGSMVRSSHRASCPRPRRGDRRRSARSRCSFRIAWTGRAAPPTSIRRLD